MDHDRQSQMGRREFVGAAAAAITAPYLVVAKATNPVVIKDGGMEFECIHGWPQLPEKYTWQTSHNVAVDSQGFLYVIHEGREGQPEHPSIFVFDPAGKFVRAFGQQFQGGGHGIEVRKEGNQEFLYIAAYQQVKSFAKLDLYGETVWQKFAPMESGVYAEGEAATPKKVWGRDRFLPTNFAFTDDGGFLLADGYGSFYIHRYDKAGNWVSKFGGPGNGKGTFNTPHGLWIDRRPGKDAEIVVTDRAHNTIQYFDMDGKYLRTQAGFGLPANIDTHGDLLAVPELVARVSLLDTKGNVVAKLGDDIARVSADSKRAIRSTPSEWQDGKFVHPHDACFDADGNLFVAEWVATGRITRLKRLA